MVAIRKEEWSCVQLNLSHRKIGVGRRIVGRKAA